MPLMNAGQKQEFLTNINGAFHNLGHPLHRAIDVLFERKPDDVAATPEQNAYITHIFGERPQDASLLKNFKEACLHAAKNLADSDGKLVDVVLFERAIDEAIHLFVQSSLIGEKQLSKDFFEQQKLKGHLLDGVSSSQDFLRIANSHIVQTCDALREKVGARHALPVANLQLAIQQALQQYLRTNFAPEDLEALKQSITNATEVCAGKCKVKLQPELADYVKAAGLALLGTLLGLVLFPLTVASARYQSWLGNTFFSGVSSKMDATHVETVRAGVSPDPVAGMAENWVSEVSIQLNR